MYLEKEREREISSTCVGVGERGEGESGEGESGEGDSGEGVSGEGESEEGERKNFISNVCERAKERENHLLSMRGGDKHRQREGEYREREGMRNTWREREREGWVV